MIIVIRNNHGSHLYLPEDVVVSDGRVLVVAQAVVPTYEHLVTDLRLCLLQSQHLVSNSLRRPEHRQLYITAEALTKRWLLFTTAATESVATAVTDVSAAAATAAETLTTTEARINNISSYDCHC